MTIILILTREHHGTTKVGSPEGGDQGVLNNGLCPNWFNVGPTDKDCGRLPWVYVYWYKRKLWRVVTFFINIDVL